jgi:hypothetical protein
MAYNETLMKGTTMSDTIETPKTSIFTKMMIAAKTDEEFGIADCTEDDIATLEKLLKLKKFFKRVVVPTVVIVPVTIVAYKLAFNNLNKTEDSDTENEDV